MNREDDECENQISKKWVTAMLLVQEVSSVSFVCGIRVAV